MKRTIVNDEERWKILREHMLAHLSEDDLRKIQYERLFPAVIVCNAEQERLRQEQLRLEGELREMRFGDPRRRPVAQELVRTAFYYDELQKHLHRLIAELYRRLCGGDDPFNGPDPERLADYLTYDLHIDFNAKILGLYGYGPDRIWLTTGLLPEAAGNALRELFWPAYYLTGGEDPDGRVILARQYDGAGVVLLVDREDLD